MSDGPSGIEWFLARDGQQYGPLNENEMRAFVDLGHLRMTDLIWRVGFAEWRSAPEVFAIHAQPAAPVSQPIAEPSPAGLQGHYASNNPAAGAAAAYAPVAEPAPAPAGGPSAAASAPSAGPAELTSPDQLHSLSHAPAAAHSPVEQRATAPQTHAAAPTQAPQAVQHPSPHPTDRPRPGQQPRYQQAGRAAHQRAPARQPISVPAEQDPYPDDFADDAEDHRDRRFGLARIAAGVGLVALLGAGAFAYLKRDQLSAVLPASVPRIALSSDAPKASTVPPLGATPDAVDESFQRVPIWRHIKQEFPEWYAERVKETAKLASEKRGDEAVAKHLAEAIVSLRRKHAEQALTASPERLKFVASAFLDNLQALSKQNVDTCYGFISQGETYPPILEMLHRPDVNAGLQKQIVAVFEAIADGRKAPQNYLPPRKADYDLLAAELSARGWSENDLRVFSDPRALGRASPQEVCRMVQDWFAAQIAIKDPASQLRLLVESLRPVVAG